MVAVIMAGGVGTRFWPLSTSKIPKQFLDLFGDSTLLQLSFHRACKLVPPERVLVLTNVAHVETVKKQLPRLPVENIIGEPVRCDTAAAVSLAAALCRKRFGNPVMIMLTADHLIEPAEVFRQAVLSAVAVARKKDVLYTFGIPPDFPATGYGYLEVGRKVADDNGVEHFELLSFKEKPDFETALRYVKSQKYYWNSGMFVWATDAILKQIQRHLPAHFKELSRVAALDRTAEWDDAISAAFRRLNPISIDFAVMEKASNIRCVASKFSWSDVGGWLALKDHLPRDRAGNWCRGRTITLDATDNLIFCQDPSETVMLIGIKDLVIVRAGNRSLIVHKDRTEDIKKLVASTENQE